MIFRSTFLLTLIASIGSVLSSESDDCTKLPSWTIQDFKTKSQDSVGSSGTASFTIVTVSTGKSDALTCKLVANYRCTITGIPSDKAVTVDFETRTDSVYFSISKTITCNGASQLVVANGDLNMNCSIPVQFKDTSCVADNGTIQGVLA